MRIFNCEKEVLFALNTSLPQRKQRGITFIGCGNYHYVTSLLLKEITKPFTLVLFDNHPDLGTKQDQANHLLSCGPWVSLALLNIPLLKRVIIIGPTTSIVDQCTDPRVAIFPGDRHYAVKSILSAMNTQNIYISIDKDVINSTEVETNWDKGVMTVSLLVHFLDIF